MASPDAPPITIYEVRAIARLANLELEPDELQRMTRELGDILAYVRQLSELDLTDVPPTMGGLRESILAPDALERRTLPSPEPAETERVGLRPDTPEASLPVDIALREAPRAHDGGFAVPAFVDEG